MNPTKHSPLMRALFTGFASLLGVACFHPVAASAATDPWIGNTSTSWSTGVNWSGGSVPASGDTVVFGVPGSSGTVLVGTTATLGGNGTDGIDFTTSAPSYTIDTGALTLSSSSGGIAIRDLSSFVQTFGASIPFTLSGAQTIQVGSSTGPVLSSLTISSAISGGQRLTKTGNGILTLGVANTLAGLTVNAGTLSIAADNRLSGTAPVSATPGWIVLDGGALRISAGGVAINANRGIALGNATAGSGGTINTFAAFAGATTTYNGIIANNGAANNSLTKTGGAILSLGGSNSYTGETRIDQGQLTLDFTAAGAPASNIVNSSSALVMGGLPTALTSLANLTYGGAVSPGAPILFVQGSSTANSTQTFNGLTVAPGYANLVARGNGNFTATVDLGAISHTAGGTASFSSLTSVSGGGQGIFTTTTANTNGILGAWATAAASANGTAAIASTDWAANDGSNNIVAYTGYTVTGTAAGYGNSTAPTIASDGTKNLKIDGTSTGNVVSTAGLTDVNTIQATDSLARTIAIGTGNTLRLGASGGVWQTTGVNLTIGATTATGGNLTVGGATDAAGEIVFNSSAGAANITVNSVIANNGAGAVSMVKTGSGVLTLNNANTYGGGTYVNRGTIQFANSVNTGLGTGDVTILSGGTVILSKSASYANNFNIAGAGPLVLNGGTVSGTVSLLGNSLIKNAQTTAATISGQITGDYSLSFHTNTVGQTTSFILSNSSNNYTGNTGLASFPLDQSQGTTIDNQILTLQLGADNVLPNGVGKGNIIIASNSATYFSTLDLNGKTETINGLTSSGADPTQSCITNTANSTTSSLTLGDNDVTTNYAGLILYGGTGGGTGDIAITKIGAGTQTFSGNNTYTGTTTITVGTLVAQADKALGNTSSVLVNGGTLDIQGTTAGTVTLGTGASFFLSSGTIKLQLGTSLDQLVSSGTGAFTITGGAFALDVTGVGFSYSSTYAVLSGFGGANSVSGLSFTGYDTGNYTASLGTNGVLSFAAVPEPATWALLAFSLTTIMVMRRRRLGA